MRKVLIIIIFLQNSFFLRAQFFITGIDPAKLQCSEIILPHFELVYPDDFQNQAMRVANIFEYCYDLVPRTMMSNIPKTPLLIHSQSSYSNGITSWAPRRIEMFPVPPQDNMYGQDWFEQLALHEFRHISQFNNFDRGFTRFGNLLFGEAATAIISAALISPYFFEGDAVMSESALSHTGRGRQPWFQMETRAYLLEKNKLYSYRKVTLGSYRDYIPDYYQFGFLYVGTIRNKYGWQVWDNTVKYVGTKPYVFYPLLHRDGNSFLCFFLFTCLENKYRKAS